MKKREKKDTAKCRNHFMKIRLTQQEYDYFMEKYKNSRCDNFSDFVRRCIFDGVILQIDKNKLQDINRKLNGINNNVNQMTVRLTKNDDTYLNDFKEIEEQIYAIWKIDMFIRRIAVHVPSEES